MKREDTGDEFLVVLSEQYSLNTVAFPMKPVTNRQD